jgi:hypothetical protein
MELESISVCTANARQFIVNIRRESELMQPLAVSNNEQNGMYLRGVAE